MKERPPVHTVAGCPAEAMLLAQAHTLTTPEPAVLCCVLGPLTLPYKHEAVRT
jgi:hypothetical protein